MEAKGKSILRLSGILLIIFGIASIALAFWILSLDKADLASLDMVPTLLTDHAAKQSLWSLTLIYGTSALQIIGGLIVVTMAGKAEKYKVCLIIGMILVGLGYATSASSEFNIISYIIQLGVPGMTMGGAFMNRNSLHR